MSAYVIVEIHVTDSEGYEGYKKLTPASISKYGGKFVVRGGPTEILEWFDSPSEGLLAHHKGDWKPGRIVVVEFPSAARAREWWDSPEYAEAKKIRQRTAKTRMIVVEGASL